MFGFPSFELIVVFFWLCLSPMWAGRACAVFAPGYGPILGRMGVVQKWLVLTLVVQTLVVQTLVARVSGAGRLRSLRCTALA